MPRESPIRPVAADPDWLTLGQAAKYLGVAQSTIRKWSDDGRVRAFYTPGGHRRYRRGGVGAVPHPPGPAALWGGGSGRVPRALGTERRQRPGRADRRRRRAPARVRAREPGDGG